MTDPSPLRLPAIDPGRCTGCGRCVAVCPPHVLSLQRVGWDKHAVLDHPPGCTGCAACAVACPFHAITMRRPDPADASTGPVPAPSASHPTG